MRGSGANDTAVTFRATPTNANAALSQLEYQAYPHYNGPDRIVITANDLGGTGFVDRTPLSNEPDSSGARTASQVLPVFVNAVEDAPEWVLPPDALVTTQEDVALVLDGLALSDNDVSGNCASGSGTVSASDTVLTSGTAVVYKTRRETFGSSRSTSLGSSCLLSRPGALSSS